MHVISQSTLIKILYRQIIEMNSVLSYVIKMIKMIPKSSLEVSHKIIKKRSALIIIFSINIFHVHKIIKQYKLIIIRQSRRSGLVHPATLNNQAFNHLSQLLNIHKILQINIRYSRYGGILNLTWDTRIPQLMFTRMFKENEMQHLNIKKIHQIIYPVFFKWRNSQLDIADQEYLNWDVQGVNRYLLYGSIPCHCIVLDSIAQVV